MSIDNPQNFDCIAAAQYLHEFFDGELSPERRMAMESHLASCADCAATLAHLRQIETAHRHLDAQLEMPAEAYWQALPQRVLEKVKASEKRRLLVLPKLSRLKSSVKRTPVSAPAPKQDLLHLTPTWQKFLRSSGKYVLPAAAAATFCFFMIRELLEKPETAMLTASAPEQPRVEAQSAHEEKVSEKAQPAPMAEAPAQKLATSRRTAQPPTDKRTDDTLFATAEHAAGAGQALSEAAARGVEFKPEEPQPAAPLEQAVSYRTEAPAGLKATAAKTTDDQLAQSAESRAKQVSTAGRMGASATALRQAENIIVTPYNQALQRAQQTLDLKKRESVWRDFLESNPDSLSRTMATAEIARTLVAASDSTTPPEQLERNIAFYREHAATLRAQMGNAEYEREFARLQMLLNFRKSK